MHCINCGYALPSSNVEECKICGVKFPFKCSGCGYPNPLMSNYCFHCGKKIIKMGIESAAVNSSMLSENRRNIAVLFADVSGFTALSEKMDPEEVREIINDCFEFITRPVYSLEGTIDKYMGDCVMVLFGAKHPHSDDPKRAVTCGLEMLKRVKKYSTERLHDKGIVLNISIGINYGLVVTGSVGNYYDKDYTVMGDVVNTAQRLQSIANKGTILVSESIYQETHDTVYYTEPAAYNVKNKQKSLLCYSPIALKNMDVSTALPLIERDEQLALLNMIYNDRKDTCCINVLGEAGIGKTSLIKEFLGNIDQGSNAIWVECVSMLRNKSYNVIINILNKIVGIDPEESNKTKQSKLRTYINYLLRELKEEDIIKNFNFLSLVMNLDIDKDFQNILNSMKYEDIQYQILNQLLIFFRNLDNSTTHIFIIDGMQWGDSNSLYLLRKLVESLCERNLIFIFVSRRKVNEICAIKKESLYYLEVGSLGREGINELLCNLLGCRLIHTDLMDTLVQLTKGNPFYIKEFIASAKRKNHIRIEKNEASIENNQLASIPNTIDGLVLSNLSELDDASKEFLNVAAIIGKEFNLSWVMSLLNSNIEEDLLNLPVKLGFISLKSVYTTPSAIERVFTFSQDVVREVIYDGILNKTKKRIHKRLGELIEVKYSKELENYYEILCNHFEAADVNEKVLGYYYKIALKYKNDFNFSSSVVYFHKFLDAIKNIENDEMQLKKIRVLSDLGYIHTSMAKYDAALSYLNEAKTTATLSDDIYLISIAISNIYKEKGMFQEAIVILNELQPKIRENTSLFGKLLQLKCSILSILGDSEALDLAQKSETTLLKMQDYENLSETMNQAAILYFIKGDVDNSILYLDKAYKYAMELNHLRLMARISVNLGIIYHASGFISKALEYFSTSMQLSDRISDTLTTLTSKINLGILYLEKGKLNKSETLLNEALRLSQNISSILNACIALTNLGDVAYEKGDFDNALIFYRESSHIALEHNMPVYEGINDLGISKVHFQNKNYDEFLTFLQKAYDIFNNAEETSYISDYYRYRSKYELVHSNLPLALEYCRQSLAISEGIKNEMKMLKALRLQANIYGRMGEYSKALELLDQSILMAERLESPYELCKGYYCKYLILWKVNNTKEAQVCLSKALHEAEESGESRWTKILKKHFVQ